MRRSVVCFSSATWANTDGRDQQKSKNTKKIQKSREKRCAGREARSEEDGSSASAALVAHDSLRLANYALRSIRHRPINHAGARCITNTSAAAPRTQWEMISLQTGVAGKKYMQIYILMVRVQVSWWTTGRTYVGQLGTGMRKVTQSHSVSSRMIISHCGQ